MGYALNTAEVISQKRALQLASKGLKVKNDIIDGYYIINRYRKYKYYPEVDITFYGKINCRIARGFREWHNSDVQIKKNISKIKLNRFLRKALMPDVKRHAMFFGIDLVHYSEIKKIIWKS